MPPPQRLRRRKPIAHEQRQAGKRLLLINPNSSEATTTMMVAIAQDVAGSEFRVVGATAARSPPMIVEPVALAASAVEVLEIALAHRDRCDDGLIVAAFGDPGLVEIRKRLPVPATGIAEAAMREAAQDGHRFGIATTTAALAAQIEARVAELGFREQFAGTRFTAGDPYDLVADPARLRAALTKVVALCIRHDGADAVIIGGGPLGQAALELQSLFSVPIIAPIPAAVRRVVALIRAGDDAAG